MLLEHERNSGLGMDSLGTACSWNTNGIVVLSWMLWSSHSFQDERDYGFGMDALVIALIKRRTGLWFGHGCSGDRMLIKR